VGDEREGKTKIKEMGWKYRKEEEEEERESESRGNIWQRSDKYK
jgi:hypothetical protein